MRHQAIAAFVLSLAVAHAAAAQETAEFDPKALRSDTAADAEIDRIQKMPIPVYELLPDSVREAQTTARAYRNVQERESPVSQTDLDRAGTDARAAASRLVAATATCSEEEVDQSFAALQDAFGRNRIAYYQYENDPRFREQLSPPEKSAEQELTTAFNREDMSASQICARLADPATQKRLVDAVTNWFERQKKLASFVQAAYDAEKPRAKKLENAWLAREKALTDALNKSRVGADQLLSALPWYIVIFCVFGLALIGMMRLFHGDVQMEWIASGQVIQFATVMVLLIVIAALGIAHILNENTLGTLLGGVAGYVLSQGVGRAVARATERAVETGPKRAIGSADLRNDVLVRLMAHTSVSPSSDTLTLDQDLKIDPTKRDQLLIDINALIRQRGGRELTSAEMTQCRTVADLIARVSAALH
ncbi:MAG TPA: hypothetical protein VF787_20580 [Thermoanaerobaculia bacterium]